MSEQPNRGRPLPLDDQLCFALYSTSLAMTQIYKPLLEPLGLTYPQYLVMLILWEKEGLGLKDIGEKLGQKSGALTPVIKRLEKDGFLVRTRSEEDERSLVIMLTEKGRDLAGPAARIVPCMIEACGIPVEDIRTLRSTLKNLRGNLLQWHE